MIRDLERKILRERARQVVFGLVFSLKKNVSKAWIFKEGEEINRNCLAVSCACGG